MEKLREVKDYESFCTWIADKLKKSEIQSCYDINTCEYLDKLEENGFDPKHIRMILHFMNNYLSDEVNNPNKAEVKKYKEYRRIISRSIIV